MAPKWLRRSGRGDSARIAAVSSPSGPPDPELPPAPGKNVPAGLWCACHPPGTGECPGCADGNCRHCGGAGCYRCSAAFAGDYYEGLIAEARAYLAPPPLPGLGADVMLVVAAVPGKVPEQWQEAGPLWFAWPHAEGAWLAEEMTAAQLRTRLDTR